MEKFTEIEKDLQIIEDFFVDEDDSESFNSMCSKMDISPTDYMAIKNSEQVPTKMQLENIYNFAYNKGLFLNEITWQECLDEYRQSDIQVCSHGARTNIKGNIRLDASGDSNDFASGFYIGQDISQAGMFVGDEPNSSLYCVTFDPSGLECARFTVNVEWMLAIGLFRERLNGYENTPKLLEIQNKVDSCDYVLAPIADNKMFEVIDAFTNGEITDLQCLYALSATHLGYQYVLKTQKALDNLNIINHLYYCGMEKSLYNREADIETNTSLNKAIIARKRYSGKGKYINEILGDIILDEARKKKKKKRFTLSPFNQYNILPDYEDGIDNFNQAADVNMGGGDAMGESINTKLSDKDKDKLKDFVDKTDDTEEIETYIKGLQSK